MHHRRPPCENYTPSEDSEEHRPSTPSREHDGQSRTPLELVAFRIPEVLCMDSCPDDQRYNCFRCQESFTTYSSGLPFNKINKLQVSNYNSHREVKVHAGHSR